MRPWVVLALLLVSGPVAAQTIAFISDLNGRYGSSSYDERIEGAVEALARIGPDLVISTGDMVAGQKTRLDGEDLDRMWAAFDLVVTGPLAHAGLPLLVTPGNHDGSGYPEFAVERRRFEAQWRDRWPELELLPGSEWPTRYAARAGDLLLLAFDGTRSGALPESERAFIATMLERHGAAAAVTVVFGHLPMWPLARGRESQILDDPALLDLLHRHGVDVYASGHHHVFYPGVDSAGMLHLSVGALGGNARSFSGHWKTEPHSLALLRVADGALQASAQAAPGYEAPVPAQGLPGSVTGPLGVLRRADGPVPLRP
ncbi:MAG: metallophosphoesterase family protein [Gammaproteobacteria bacterium]